jgi:hypothetical protein
MSITHANRDTSYAPAQSATFNCMILVIDIYASGKICNISRYDFGRMLPRPRPGPEPCATHRKYKYFEN